MKKFPITMPHICREQDELCRQIERLKADNRAAWKRVDEAAQTVSDYEEIKTEVERLKEVLRRLHTRIDDPAWTIKSHLETIEKALAAQPQKGIGK